MKFRTTLFASIALAGLAVSASAQPVAPVYTRTLTDATTGDNSFNFGGFRWWNVDAGADSYQNDIYERPLTQTFQPVAGTYAGEEYHGYVDIAEARFGFDNRYLYASIRVVSLLKQTKDGVDTIEGLIARYGVRFSEDADGRNGIFLIADQPQTAALPNTVYTNVKTEGWRDTDQDVGGRGGPIHGQPGPSGVSVTKVNNPLEEFGLNGFEQQFIQSDGILTNGGEIVLWQRVSPSSNTTIEIALDYVAAGLTQAQIANIQFLDFIASAGNPRGPQDCLWNDKYTGLEAGSPNIGIGGLSEFGTQGLVNIYLSDNVRAAAGGTACYANCDASTIVPFVNVSDFTCFLNKFAANDPAANCDGSVSAPVLNVNDFTCFLNAYAAGCSAP
ncbi:MAG: GC-type dockerin domain-anchored protein [Phycisphaerales bacterium]